MARTMDPVAHRERREAFVEAAALLIQQKGYEAFSLGDVIDSVGASKGALYHYFDSKAALLDATVERMVEGALAALDTYVTDPDLSAAGKLEAIFAGLAQWKAERKDLLLAVMQVWYSDENTVVREHLRRATSTRLTPVLLGVVAQGVDEGVFRVRSVAGTAEVLVALVLGANEKASRLWLARQAGEVSFDEVESILAAFGEAFERVLDLPSGSLTLVSTDTLHQWYG